MESPKPRPLFETYRRNSAMVALARKQADPLGRQWNLWAPPEREYEDAIRPSEWIIRKNPSLKLRATFGGQLAASVLITLKCNPDAGASESGLARRCKATRCAVRDALDHLSLCQLIRRRRVGNFTHILLLA